MVKTTMDYLGKTRNGCKVFDREDSHFHEEGGLSLELLRKGLKKIQFPKEETFKKFEVEFDENIGFTTCVEITEEDEVVYVYRKGRPLKTKMVKNRKPEACKWMTIILRKEKNYPNHYTLITAYIGAGSTPEPWDPVLLMNPDDKLAAEKYWDKHALVYDENQIDKGRTKIA